MLDAADLTLPEPGPDDAQVVVGLPRRRRIERHDRRADARGPVPRCAPARAWSCARFPGSTAAANVSGHELVARALPATGDGSLDEDAAAEVLKEVERYRVVAIGPGLGRDAATQSAACTHRRGSRRPDS